MDRSNAVRVRTEKYRKVEKWKGRVTYLSKIASSIAHGSGSVEATVTNCVWKLSCGDAPPNKN
jgi:hypothetical protein